ncbi:MAG: hypothetical protein HND53_01985 [Proteobacteria bacterium]|nr:hypothetical protein [Pseudomonadota bacterium]
MQQELNKVDVDETDNSSLLDCYRIAIDFGMPAALKAYEKLAIESTQISEESIAIDN